MFPDSPARESLTREKTIRESLTRKSLALWTLAFCLTSAFLLTFAAFAEEENDSAVQRLTFADSGKALNNPQMGWTMHFYSNSPQHYGKHLEPSDSLDWFEGCSTVYLRIPWAFIEPEEGKFNWAILDTPAQRWIAAGKKVAFRFTTSESWLEYAAPKWVYDAGAKGLRYSFKGGPSPDGDLCDPVFDDPIYLEKLRNFLLAAGKRYDGNPNIAFIDVGTFGMWGEGHTGFSSRLNPEETFKVTKIHIDLHLEAFPNTLLCISDDVDGPENTSGNYPVTDYARSKGVTLRDDSILVQRAPRMWFHADMADRFWRELPVIIEHEHFGSSKQNGAWDDDLLLRSVEEYHGSFMSIHGWPQDEWESCRETIRKINLRLGYRLQLRELEYPKTVEIGKPFHIKTLWANAGVAPCYPGGFMTLTLKDEKGGIVAVLSDESFDLRNLPVAPPDAIPTREHESEFCAGLIAPTTKSGQYDLFISVGKRDGTPEIALPLENDDGQRRYRIGKITLK